MVVPEGHLGFDFVALNLQFWIDKSRFFPIQPDPHRTPTPRFVRWDSGLPLRCDLLVRSLLPA
jgi:hypothetical protein